MKRPPKLYEYEPDESTITIGTFDSFTEVPTDDVKTKPQIGFVRQQTEFIHPRKKVPKVLKKKKK